MIACSVWKPAPCASCHGSRKLNSRARRYGSNQIAASRARTRRAAGGEHPQRHARHDENRGEDDPDRDHGPEVGLEQDQPAKSPVVIPIGRASSFSVCGAGRRARYAAAQIARLSLASSEGWKASEPTPSQRRAPFTCSPTTSTASAEREARQHRGRREVAERPVIDPRPQDHQQHDPDPRRRSPRA